MWLIIFYLFYLFLYVSLRLPFMTIQHTTNTVFCALRFKACDLSAHLLFSMIILISSLQIFLCLPFSPYTRQIYYNTTWWAHHFPSKFAMNPSNLIDDESMRISVSVRILICLYSRLYNHLIIRQEQIHLPTIHFHSHYSVWVFVIDYPNSFSPYTASISLSLFI